jgi:hypothetical protein
MDSNQDDFKWFGEGFAGFPKRLPDDTVEYAIFVIDSKLAEAQIASRLRTVLQDTSALSKKLLKDYIWQRDEFALELKRDDGKSAITFRVGVVVDLGHSGMGPPRTNKLWGLGSR